MLAPITIGTAVSTGKTPDPTSPTIVAVVTEDDWTRTVARIPAARPDGCEDVVDEVGPECADAGLE
jgi:hypothetical protein